MIYAEIMNEQTGARLAGRSTGTKNREAMKNAVSWQEIYARKRQEQIAK
jgi:hypothetical protein